METTGQSMAPPTFQLQASQNDQASSIVQMQADSDIYIVKPGDSPAGIAARHNISLEALLNANGYRLSTDPEEQAKGVLIHIATGKKKVLDAGDRLIIPTSAKSTGNAISAGVERATTGIANYFGAVATGFAAEPNMTYGRHVVSKANFLPKSSGNSLLLENVTKAQLKQLYIEASHKGVRDGYVSLRNGQKWYINASNGKFHPVSGPGIINLTSVEMNVLAGFRKAALKDPQAAINAIVQQLKGRKIKISPNMKAALEILSVKHNVPADDLLKAVAGLLDDTAKVEPSLIKQAESISRGRAFKIVKYGGRVLLLVAVAADMYELYEADFAAKEVLKKGGGWAGSLTASGVAGKAASPLLAGGPWGWVGYGVIVVGAGIGGYFAGEAAGEAIYEHGWNKQ